MKTMFGFEIGQPAYPDYDDSWKKMVLKENDVVNILNMNAPEHDGIIMWETFSDISDHTYSNEATAKYVL